MRFYIHRSRSAAASSVTVADGVLDTWRVTGDTQHVTHDKWYLTLGTWHLILKKYIYLYQFYYSHMLRDSVSPVCVIFLGIFFKYFFLGFLGCSCLLPGFSGDRWYVTGHTWHIKHGRWQICLTFCLFWWYYPHMLRDLLCPECRIFIELDRWVDSVSKPWCSSMCVSVFLCVCATFGSFF